MTSKAWTAAVLLVRFVRAVVLSGAQTAAVIVRSMGRPPPVALLRMRFAPMSPAGASLLGAMVTLTPGSTTLDIDLDRHELLIHVLDARDPEAIVAGIRTEFERPLAALFGTTH